MPGTERDRLPGPAVSPLRRTIRYWIARLVASIVARGYLRVRLVGRERLPPGPAIYCFNHMSWADPFALMAVLPLRPRLWFFGPKEEDMGVGGRNRVMTAWHMPRLPAALAPHNTEGARPAPSAQRVQPCRNEGGPTPPTAVLAG